MIQYFLLIILENVFSKIFPFKRIIEVHFFTLPHFFHRTFLFLFVLFVFIDISLFFLTKITGVFCNYSINVPQTYTFQSPLNRMKYKLMLLKW